MHYYLKMIICGYGCQKVFFNFVIVFLHKAGSVLYNLTAVSREILFAIPVG